ncbi:MAG: tRNA (adenosine(37)-N6)-threonylcarbamoyltransferase complex transferase subunit TsaD [Patescibacteria group bacterium]
MIILGIETSCDETAVSVVRAEGSVEKPVFKVLGSALVSQIKLHAEYGGVYPNLAKREHIKNLPIVLDKALKDAKIKIKNIDAIAVTVGPGLEPALWTGINFAQDLSREWGVPLIPTNHMEGHIASVLLSKTDENPKFEAPNNKPRTKASFIRGRRIQNSNIETQNKIKFPAIALLISGGHTELVYLKSWQEKEIIGETKDDAVGEAFDKVARMLGLPYPGGPEISKLAEDARSKNLHLETKFPRPMIHSGDLNFSFSGLKTAVLYYLRDMGFSALSPLPLTRGGVGGEVVSDKLKLSVAREFEDAVVEVLVSKSRQAILKFNPKTFIVGGGVIANYKIRESFENLKEEFSDLILRIPEKDLATDNAVMIAMAGYFSHVFSPSKIELKAKGNLKYS